MCKTCIVAEHDPWEIRLLRIYLERLGFRLIQAFDGRDTLRLACTEQPDVIILDADLPGVPAGADLLAALKTDDRTRDIPVVWFSWPDAEPTEAPGVRSAGRLGKPATYETFAAALAQAGICEPIPPEESGVYWSNRTDQPDEFIHQGEVP